MDYLNTPSVVGAVIYDRMVGKDERPHLNDGYNMAKNASYNNLLQGNIGVGIGAFVVTNAIGDVVNPRTNMFYSECGCYELNNYYKIKNARGTNTTLAVIVTNIEMNREELIKVSELAQDGMARAIYPVHTNWDGDVIFSISPHCENRIKLDMKSFDLVNYVGIIASNVLIEAINNSIKNAESIEGFQSYNDIIKNKNNK